MTSPSERQEILAQLEAELGHPATPDDIVAAATPENHPLHDDFEWNDGAAAHAWRLNQARSIIRTVTIQSIIRGRTVESVVYVRNPSAGRAQGYINVRTIEPKSREAMRVIEMCVQRIRAHIATARGVAAILDLESELEVMLEALIILERKARGIALRKATAKRGKARPAKK